MQNYLGQLSEAAKWIEEAECIVIGAGSGLSAAAGFDYDKERFDAYLGDFGRKYGFHNMYEGGFYPYPTKGEYWGYWSRFIYINRYMDPPVPVYQNLYQLVKDKNYFVLTTNVDHMFQKAGFAKDRLFYTQGDYGLFQTVDGQLKKTWENREDVVRMLKDQGFSFDEKGRLIPARGNPNGPIKMSVSEEAIPKDPFTHQDVRPNLREDSRFVEDEGWHAAAKRYEAFLDQAYSKKTLFLELGVGWNTPGIIKYPFQQMILQFPQAHMVSISMDRPPAPKSDRFLFIQADISDAVLGIDKLITAREEPSNL